MELDQNMRQSTYVKICVKLQEPNRQQHLQYTTQLLKSGTIELSGLDVSPL